MKISYRCLLLWLFLALSAIANVHSATLSNQQQLDQCSFTVDGKWWDSTHASMPSDVANNPITGDPEFCEFYQFAQDWFLYLISPSGVSDLANWEDPSQYPLLETQGNSCDSSPSDRALFIRTAKTDDAARAPVWPERIDQAGRDVHAIYDQNGNVVFYEVRFSKNLCDYQSIQSANNFPGKTVELKLAWRILGVDEDETLSSSYYQTEANINGIDYRLGLVGWHIVVSADNHPEMVWITLDHRNNAMDCSAAGFLGQPEYAFTSKACAADTENCHNLNESLNSTAITLPSGTKPNDICKEFPYGTLEGQGIDTKDGLNIALIKKLNFEMASVLSQSGVPAGLDVWKNYGFKGALWQSDITQPSSVTLNQRGSLELANAVMETTFQGESGTAGSAVNCFACHGFQGSGKDNTSYGASLSHTFDDVIDGQCRDVQTAKVVNSQSQASATCPTTCSSSVSAPSWNGQWTNQNASTGQQLPMTVCGCCPAPIVQ